MQLCTNALCQNDDFDKIENRILVCETETLYLVKCLDCYEEMLEDDWCDVVMTELEELHRLHKRMHSDLVQSPPTQKQHTFQTTTEPLEGSGGSFDTESVFELMPDIPCGRCSKTSVPVFGDEGELIEWLCKSCEQSTGIDDSYTRKDEYQKTIKMLMDLLEDHAKRNSPCSAGPNEDIIDIILKVIGGREGALSAAERFARDKVRRMCDDVSDLYKKKKAGELTTWKFIKCAIEQCTPSIGVIALVLAAILLYVFVLNKIDTNTGWGKILPILQKCLVPSR